MDHWRLDSVKQSNGITEDPNRQPILSKPGRYISLGGEIYPVALDSAV
jgi:hypothetical protein